jgi:class 3 adenylate cyclase/ketosteroid isomerase-like protein
VKAGPQVEADVAQVYARMLGAYRDRDADAFVSLFAPDPDVFMQGTGQDEARTGLPAIRAQIERDIAQSEAVSVTPRRLSVSGAGSVAWIASEMSVRVTVGGRPLDLPLFRVTGVLERRATGWLFVQLHLSYSDAAQPVGESWPTSLEAVASAVEREAVDLHDRAAPDGTVTLLFSDIEDSTPMAEQLGDLRWIEVLRTHNATVREHVARHGGFEVKTIGDAFMIAFGSARRALQCAIDLQHALADQPIRVRIGLHSGEPVREGNDFHGKSVILASRITGHARGGEILVSSLLRDLVESAGDIRFDEGREVALKGLAGTHRVYAVRLD